MRQPIINVPGVSPRLTIGSFKGELRLLPTIAVRPCACC
jgi:hypothetical protein